MYLPVKRQRRSDARTESPVDEVEKARIEQSAKNISKRRQKNPQMVFTSTLKQIINRCGINYVD